jgi:hypothetical protein
MTRAIAFTKAQVRRAVQAAESAGMTVRGVRVYPDGSIEVLSGETAINTAGHAGHSLAGSWDDLK